MSLLIGTNGTPGFPTEASASTERRCPGCREVVPPKPRKTAPTAATPQPDSTNGYGTHSWTGKLHMQQASAQKEKDYARAHGLD